MYTNEAAVLLALIMDSEMTIDDVILALNHHYRDRWYDYLVEKAIEMINSLEYDKQIKDDIIAHLKENME